MTSKLDPDERVLEYLYKKIEAKKNKELDDKYNYDTYSK